MLETRQRLTGEVYSRDLIKRGNTQPIGPRWAFQKTSGIHLTNITASRRSSATATCIRCFLLAALFVVVAGAEPLLGQIPIPTPTQQPEDTITVEPFRVRPPVSPLGAMARSLLFPGWGQSVLGRRTTGAVFVFWEGVTLGMTLKAAHQLSFLRRADDSRPEDSRDQELLDSKKAEVQDWLVLLAFNHLFAAAEAFVSANLWDFPEEISMRSLPDERVALTVSFSFR